VIFVKLVYLFVNIAQYLYVCTNFGCYYTDDLTSYKMQLNVVVVLIFTKMAGPSRLFLVDHCSIPQKSNFLM